MTYQLVAFDLDGTLLNSQGQILAESKEAIQNAREKGAKVVLVTGRHHTAVKPYYTELGLDTPIICCNGAYVYQPQTDEILVANPLNEAQIQHMLNVAKQTGVHLLMYSRDAMNFITLNPHMEKFQQWVQSCPENMRPNVRQVADFEEVVAHNPPILKFVVSSPDRQLMLDTIAQLPENEFSCEWSWIDRVDVANHGNSKGARLLELLKQWQIDPKNVIAFGDNHNDVSMLKAVGLGVAMGNAEEEVKAQAKFVTKSNNEAGIAEVLAQHFGS